MQGDVVPTEEVEGGGAQDDEGSLFGDGDLSPPRYEEPDKSL